MRSSPTPSAPASRARRASVVDETLASRVTSTPSAVVAGNARAARSSSADGSRRACADRRGGRVVRPDHDVACVAVDQDRHSVGSVDHGRVHPDHERYAERAGHDRRVRACAAEHRDRTGQLPGVRQEVRGRDLVREQDEPPGRRRGRDPAGELVADHPADLADVCCPLPQVGRGQPGHHRRVALGDLGHGVTGGDGVRAGQQPDGLLDERGVPGDQRLRGQDVGGGRGTVAPQRAGQLVEAPGGRLEGRPDLGLGGRDRRLRVAGPAPGSPAGGDHLPRGAGHRRGRRGHDPGPASAAASAARSSAVEVAPGSWCPTLRAPR